MNATKLTATIKLAEGYRVLMYDDATGQTYQHGTAPQGTLTVGWGHNCEMAFPVSVLEILLQTDLQIAERNVRAVFPSDFDGFTDARQRALVEMMFNLGARTFNEFQDMIEAIRRSAWASAAGALRNSEYAQELPDRVNRLANMLQTGQD